MSLNMRGQILPILVEQQRGHRLHVEQCVLVSCTCLQDTARVFEFLELVIDNLVGEVRLSLFSMKSKSISARFNAFYFIFENNPRIPEAYAQCAQVFGANKLGRHCRVGEHCYILATCSRTDSSNSERRSSAQKTAPARLTSKMYPDIKTQEKLCAANFARSPAPVCS